MQPAYPQHSHLVPTNESAAPAPGPPSLPPWPWQSLKPGNETDLTPPSTPWCHGGSWRPSLPPPPPPLRLPLFRLIAFVLPPFTSLLHKPLSCLDYFGNPCSGILNLAAKPACQQYYLQRRRRLQEAILQEARSYQEAILQEAILQDARRRRDCTLKSPICKPALQLCRVSRSNVRWRDTTSIPRFNC